MKSLTLSKELLLFFIANNFLPESSLSIPVPTFSFSWCLCPPEAPRAPPGEDLAAQT